MLVDIDSNDPKSEASKQWESLTEIEQEMLYECFGIDESNYEDWYNKFKQAKEKKGQ